MTGYVAVTVMPRNYVHCLCFSEVELSLNSALKELNLYDPNGRQIVLGAHVITALPENAIIFNLEQITEDSNWMTVNYLNLLKTHEVWDYSHRNILELAKLGVKAKYCGIGYAPELTKISKREEEEIDVLFYGSLNPRRMKVLNELGKHCRVATAPGYGEQRDKVIARSKIIINIHFYESKIFELVRCSYLMANSKCIVSELGNDLELEKPFYGGIFFSPYENLVGWCMDALADDVYRATCASSGFAIFSKMKQTEYLKPLI